MNVIEMNPIEPFLDEIRKRIENNRDVIVSICADKGLGMSYASIGMAKKISEMRE